MAMTDVLITRSLDEAQLQPLVGNGLSYETYEAIKIHHTQPQWSHQQADLALFTSQHAVHSVFRDGAVTLPEQVGCVGEKTAGLLESHGVQVSYSARNAEDLCRWLDSREHPEKVIYFCGNLRLAVLPDYFERRKITWEEVIVYKTELNPEAHPGPFRAILFFSPSGVHSYARVNRPEEAMAICIGPTTASAAQELTSNILIAENPSLEAVISLTSNYLTS